eukprot:scaffold19279_cov83-Isochrysis_galbana.AAC.1
MRRSGVLSSTRAWLSSRDAPLTALALPVLQALTCIKRKKMYEKQLEQIEGAPAAPPPTQLDARACASEHIALGGPPACGIARPSRRCARRTGARTTMETQKQALEQLNINKEILEAQRVGASTMASVTAQMGGVDAVDETMGQIEEGLADANEIADALSRPVAGGMDDDEDELRAELDMLEDADLETQVRQRLMRGEGRGVEGAPPNSAGLYPFVHREAGRVGAMRAGREAAHALQCARACIRGDRQSHCLFFIRMHCPHPNPTTPIPHSCAAAFAGTQYRTGRLGVRRALGAVF